MKAVVLKDFGGAENLVMEDIAAPGIKDDEVLVQVSNISINPVDVKTRKGRGLAGRLKEFDPIILGWDIAGVVMDTGAAVTDFKKGDAVFGMVNFPGHGKAYAEYVAAPAAQLAVKPPDTGFEEAAAATLAALTAWQALTKQHKIIAGEKILVHAAAGGVGHFAVQIAKYFGAYVIGTSSADNREFVLSLGADKHIDYRSEKFEEVSPVVDFVLNTIGGDNIDRSLQVIRKGGAIISLPSGLNEAVAEKAKAKGVSGSSFMVSSNGDDMRSLAELLSAGALRPHVSKVFALDDMAAAHGQIETGKTVGKVVVQI